MAFRQHVIEEALAQRDMRSRGEPIPLSQQRYARISGGVLTIVGAGGSVALWRVGLGSGLIYVGGLLFAAAIAIGGLAQLVSGRHLLTRR